MAQREDSCYYSEFTQSCRTFPKGGSCYLGYRQGLLKWLHNYSMTRAHILGNNCPQFWEAVGKIAQIAVL